MGEAPPVQWTHLGRPQAPEVVTCEWLVDEPASKPASADWPLVIPVAIILVAAPVPGAAFI